MYENTPYTSAYGVFLEVLLVVSVLLMIVGTTLLALRYKSVFRWIIAVGAAICISLAVILVLNRRGGLWVVALLYFGPQLPLLFVSKGSIAGQSGPKS